MAFGLAATGVDAVTGTRRSLADFRDQVREIVRQGLVDIMLMSVSTSEQLTFDERLFDASPITPAVRANDTTDIHALAGAVYPQQPSRPFRTATIEQIRGAARVDLGLYSITPRTTPNSTPPRSRPTGTFGSTLSARASAISSSCSLRTCPATRRPTRGAFSTTSWRARSLGSRKPAGPCY